jgi:hypothetical protein
MDLTFDDKYGYLLVSFSYKKRTGPFFKNFLGASTIIYGKKLITSGV